MAAVRWSMVALLIAVGATALVSCPARAGEVTGGSAVLSSPDAVTPQSPPGASPPLVGLQNGSALALVPPGSAAAARNDGLAGSSQTGVDLSYVPPAERDSYLNSHDFADHLQTSTRKGRHPSALSQMGGVAEGMAINGLLGAGTSLMLGGH